MIPCDTSGQELPDQAGDLGAGLVAQDDAPGSRLVCFGILNAKAFEVLGLGSLGLEHFELREIHDCFLHLREGRGVAATLDQAEPILTAFEGRRVVGIGDFDFGGGFPDPQTYDSVWSIDLELSFDINDDWTVAIGGDNITDEYPDLSSDDINFFGHLPYDVFSGIGMNGAYWYARTSFDF